MFSILHVSLLSDALCLALNYRLAPECTFPGPLHDAVSAYFRLTEDLHIPPENILVSGDSAGGGLALALLMYLRDNHYPVPAGGILMSPWVGAYDLPCVATNASSNIIRHDHEWRFLGFERSLRRHSSVFA